MMTLKYPKPTLDIYFHMKNHYRKLRSVRSRLNNVNSKRLCDIADNCGENITKSDGTSKKLTSARSTVVCKPSKLGKESSTNQSNNKQSSKLNTSRSISVPPRPTTRRNPTELPYTSAPRSQSADKYKNTPNKKKLVSNKSINTSSSYTKGSKTMVLDSIEKGPQIDHETIAVRDCVESTSFLIDKATSSCEFPCCDDPCDVCKNVSITNKSIQDHEYLQFALRITEDIIRNNLYSDREMVRVFDSHIEANRGRLKHEQMMAQIENLRQVFNISAENNEDSLSNEKELHPIVAQSSEKPSQPFASCVLHLNTESEAILQDVNIAIPKNSALIYSTSEVKPVSCLQRDNLSHHVMKEPSLDRLTEVTENSCNISESLSYQCFKQNITCSDETANTAVERNIQVPLHDNTTSATNLPDKESFIEDSISYLEPSKDVADVGEVMENEIPHKNEETSTGVGEVVITTAQTNSISHLTESSRDEESKILNFNELATMSRELFTKDSLSNTSDIHMQPCKEVSVDNNNAEDDGASEIEPAQRNISADSLEIAEKHEETGGGDVIKSEPKDAAVKDTDKSKEKEDFFLSLSNGKHISVNSTFNVYMLSKPSFEEIEKPKAKKTTQINLNGPSTPNSTKLSAVSEKGAAMIRSSINAPLKTTHPSDLTLDSYYRVKEVKKMESGNNANIANLLTSAVRPLREEDIDIETNNEISKAYESGRLEKELMRAQSAKKLHVSKPKLMPGALFPTNLSDDEISTIYTTNNGEIVKGADVTKDMKDSFENFNARHVEALEAYEPTDLEKITTRRRSGTLKNTPTAVPSKLRNLERITSTILSSGSNSTTEIDYARMQPASYHRNPSKVVHEVVHARLNEQPSTKSQNVPKIKQAAEVLSALKSDMGGMFQKEVARYSCRDDSYGQNVPQQCLKMDVCDQIVVGQKSQQHASKCGLKCDCCKKITASSPEQMRERQRKWEQAKIAERDSYYKDKVKFCDNYKRWRKGGKSDTDEVETLFFNKRMDDRVEQEVCTDEMGGLNLYEQPLPFCGNAMKTTKGQYLGEYLKQQSPSTGKGNEKMPRFNFCTKESCPGPNKNIPVKKLSDLKTAYEKSKKEANPCPCKKNLLLDDEYALPDTPENFSSIDSFYCVKHFFYPSRYTQTAEGDFEEHFAAPDPNAALLIPSSSSEESDADESAEDDSFENSNDYMLDYDETEEEGGDEEEDGGRRSSVEDDVRSLKDEKRLSSSKAKKSRSHVIVDHEYQNYMNLLDFVPVYILTPSLERCNELALTQVSHFREPDIEAKHRISSNLLATEEVIVHDRSDLTVNTMFEDEITPQSNKTFFCCFKKKSKKPQPDEVSMLSARFQERKLPPNERRLST